MLLLLLAGLQTASPCQSPTDTGLMNEAHHWRQQQHALHMLQHVLQKHQHVLRVLQYANLSLMTAMPGMASRYNLVASRDVWAVVDLGQTVLPVCNGRLAAQVVAEVCSNCRTDATTNWDN
jgi:hypothetical protein